MEMSDQGLIEEVASQRYGNDTTPLVALVPDDQYQKGMITSRPRSESGDYQAFLERARKGRK